MASERRLIDEGKALGCGRRAHAVEQKEVGDYKLGLPSLLSFDGQLWPGQHARVFVLSFDGVHSAHKHCSVVTGAYQGSHKPYRRTDDISYYKNQFLKYEKDID